MLISKTFGLAHKWRRLTSTELMDFVEVIPSSGGGEPDVLPDTVKLEEWLSPEEGESIADALTRRYGSGAANVIADLLRI